MTTKRTPINRAGRARITPEAVEAFKARNWLALHRALGLKPWEASPLSAVGECERDGTAYAHSWLQARQLRADLLAARDIAGSH